VLSVAHCSVEGATRSWLLRCDPRIERSVRAGCLWLNRRPINSLLLGGWPSVRSTRGLRLGSRPVADIALNYWPKWMGIDSGLLSLSLRVLLNLLLSHLPAICRLRKPKVGAWPFLRVHRRARRALHRFRLSFLKTSMWLRDECRLDFLLVDAVRKSRHKVMRLQGMYHKIPYNAL
jgi:hypothetical protein